MLKANHYRPFSYATVIVSLFFSIAVGLLLPSSTTMAISTDDSDPTIYDTQIASLIYYKSISYCFEKSNLSSNPWFGNQTIKATDASTYKWFDGGTSVVPGVYMKDAIQGMKSPLGAVKCDNTSLISNALSFWRANGAEGMDPTSVLCGSGFYRDNRNNCSGSGASGDFKVDDKKSLTNQFKEYIKKQVYNGQTPPELTKAQLYKFYLKSNSHACISNIESVAPKDKDSSYILGKSSWVNIKEDPATTITGYYKSTIDNPLSTSNRFFVGQGQNEGCVSLATLLTEDVANAYKDKFNEFKRSNPDTALAYARAIDENRDADSASRPTTCGEAVLGTGWIVCPLINSISGLNDGMWFIVSNLLEINPLRQSDYTYQAWESVRNIANVVFVIVFLIIIFSQVSSVGVTNYGIKKLLPRLIVGAILVNSSYIIVQLAVDIANISGSGIHQVFEAISKDNEVVPTWGKAIELLLVGGGGAVVGGIALGTVGLGAAFWFILPILLSGALALLVAMLTLMLRWAIIPILAILSPLAFVAYLLPNTEQLFKKWRSLLMAMLILYPLAALVFGGAKFAAKSVLNEGNWFTNIIGMVMLTLPLFSIPFLAAKSGSIVNGVGGVLKGMSNKASGAFGKFAGEQGGYEKDKHLAKNYDNLSNLSNGKKPRPWQFGMRTALNESNRQRLKQNSAEMINAARANYLATHLPEGATPKEKAYAQSVAEGVFEKEVKEAMATISPIHDEKLKKALDNKQPDAVRVAAIRSVMKAANYDERRQLYVAAKGSTDSVRSALKDIYYERGDNKILGAAFGDTVLRQNIDDAIINKKLVDQINSGNIGAATLDDERVIDHINKLKDAEEYKDMFTEKGNEYLGRAASDLFESEAGRAKNEAQKEKLARLARLAPTASDSGQPQPTESPILGPDGQPFKR
jgi:hypothetical protein